MWVLLLLEVFNSQQSGIRAPTGPKREKVADFEWLVNKERNMTSEEKWIFVQPLIPCFDGHYDHWSILMENLLRSKEYWSLVETGYAEPEDGVTMIEAQQKRLDELKFKDLKVKNYLFQAIDQTILETIL